MYMTIGEKIYKVRKDLALSQEEFAFRIGVSKQTVFNWENGLACPKLSRLKKISEEFDVNINYFIEEDSEDLIKDEKVIESTKGANSLKLNSLPILLTLCALFITILTIIIILGFSLFSGNKGLTHVVIIDSDIIIWLGFIFMIVISIALLIIIIFIAKKYRKKK